MESGPSARDCPAVRVKDAWLVYGDCDDAPGLKGANMLIERGTIYALLGPSGCGKTTLISSIVGLRKPEQGEVRVLGKKPRLKNSGVPGPYIGFMPQETCLLPELTLEETLSFFALLNCVPRSEHEERSRHLKKILDLPSNRYVNTLSGGQQRRLSLAVALMHNPPLLLLDEPTVGVDPLLRKAIWKFLEELVQERGSTVLLSTHYVEEARQADKVGLMRKGQILVEEEPLTLMSRYSVTSIEAVFLILCYEQSAKKDNNQIASSAAVPEDTSRSEQDTDSKSHGSSYNLASSMANSTVSLLPTNSNDESNHSNRYSRNVMVPLPNASRTCMDSFLVVYGLCWKNVLLIRRNFWFLVLAFLMPLSNFFLIRMFLGHLPVGLDVFMSSGPKESFARTFLSQHLNEAGLNIIHYSDFDEALRVAKLGKAHAIIDVPDEFSVNFVNRFRMGLEVTNDTVSRSKMKLYRDNTNMIIGTTVHIRMLQSLLSLLHDFSGILGAEVQEGGIPLKFCNPIFGSLEVELTYAIMLAEVPQSIFVTAMALAAMVFVRDRENNILNRLKSSGLGPFEIMAAHAVIQTLLSVVQITSLVSALMILKVEVLGSLVLYFVLLLLAGYIGMGAGMVISVLSNRIFAAMVLVALVQYLTIALSGIFWPLAGMHKLCRILSYCHPMTFIVRAQKLVLNNGAGLSNTEVLCTFPHCLLWILLLVVFSAFFYQDNKLEIVDSIILMKKPNLSSHFRFLSKKPAKLKK